MPFYECRRHFFQSFQFVSDMESVLAMASVTNTSTQLSSSSTPAAKIEMAIKLQHDAFLDVATVIAAISTARVRAFLLQVGLELDGVVGVEQVPPIESFLLHAVVLSVSSQPDISISGNVLTQLQSAFASALVNLTSVIYADTA